MRLTELSQGLGFSKGTTRGLIQALLKVGALDQSPFQKRVFIGASIAELALKRDRYHGITERAQTLIEALCAGIGQTVFLGVLDESAGKIIATARAANSLTVTSAPGNTFPFMAGAPAKAFLASLSDDEALKIIREKGLKPYTARSIVDEDTYLKELQWVRSNGHALDNEEYMAGFKSVGVRLGKLRGLPLLMWVVGFASVVTGKVLPNIVQKMMETAEKLKPALKNTNGDLFSANENN
jgi:DNA-binding IclR family transcriptional regulator